MRDCDLIMKGGITSGVVYPHAITEITKHYRLRAIGGTSAGAIAAVIAAAAEFRRQTAGGTMEGFDAIERTAEMLGHDLDAFFQPSSNLAAPFEILRKGASGNGTGSLVWTVLSVYRGRVFVAVLTGGAPALLAAITNAWGFMFFCLLCIPILLVVLIGFELRDIISNRLPKADFGLCTGKTQPGFHTPAITDWIADQIDHVAGRPTGDSDPPLTVGDLKTVGIEVATMTTDLSTQRPYRLPMEERRFRVRKSEMARLFSNRIVDYICTDDRFRPPLHKDDPSDLYELPVGDEFPLVLVARMSLSFPGLISAVPLWRVDYDAPSDENGKKPMARLVFSDGGICSNFPIHFFDSPLPSRPTFGIKLGPYDKTLHDERVDLPLNAREVQRLRVGKIDGVAGFLSAILNTAKDWNDTLQSQLPGYSERIVEIRLEDKEGGMNFTMDSDDVARLQGFGREAGERLVETFSNDAHDGFDQHRFNRAVSFLPSVEDVLIQFATGYESRPDQTAKSYDEVIRHLNTRVATGITQKERAEIFAPLMEELARIGADLRSARDDPNRTSVAETGTPAMDANLRLTAEAGPAPRPKQYSV